MESYAGILLPCRNGGRKATGRRLFSVFFICPQEIPFLRSNHTQMHADRCGAHRLPRSIERGGRSRFGAAYAQCGPRFGGSVQRKYLLFGEGLGRADARCVPQSGRAEPDVRFLYYREKRSLRQGILENQYPQCLRTDALCSVPFGKNPAFLAAQWFSGSGRGKPGYSRSVCHCSERAAAKHIRICSALFFSSASSGSAFSGK